MVEMEPVGLDRAEEFLTADRPPADRRWQDVLARLRAHPRYPDVPLARALSSPLMVALARAIYAPAAADPAVLLGFRDRTGRRGPSAERLPPGRLRAAPAAARYRGPGSGALRPGTGPPVAGVRRPAHEPHRTQDFAWWQVATAVPGSVRGLVIGVVSGLVFGAIGHAAGGPAIASVFGVPFALAGFLVQLAARCNPPTRVEIRFRGAGGSFLLRSAVGFVIGIALGFGFELPYDNALMLGLPFALAIGLHAWLAGARRREEGVEPRAHAPAGPHGDADAGALLRALLRPHLRNGLRLHGSVGLGLARGSGRYTASRSTWCSCSRARWPAGPSAACRTAVGAASRTAPPGRS
ncbi:hypothetical protein GCM10020221_18130 [Streptomyces thioluteus]|uniref:Membrane transporter protein n=1 Tax=Streptomyces thioluteus TaxID=66431 RepID=A0ABN3WQY3_STRTU